MHLCRGTSHVVLIIRYVTTMYRAVNAMYVQHLSMLCTASVKYSKKHSNDSSVTDMYQICDILVTALWQFQIQICNRHVTDLFCISL